MSGVVQNGYSPTRTAAGSLNNEEALVKDDTHTQDDRISSVGGDNATDGVPHYGEFESCVTAPFIPITKWPYQWPPEGGLRHLRFNEDTNGFKGVFKKVGRTVLVDVRKFWETVRRQGGGE